MLPNHDGCLPGPSVCCDALFSVGESILTHALDAVNNPDCYLDECHAPNVDGFVSMYNASTFPGTDMLTVVMQRLTPKAPRDARNGAVAPYSFTSLWQVELVESGWVTFEDDGDGGVDAVLPEPNLLHALSLHSYSHAEQMYRRLANAVSTNQISGCPAGNCQATIGDLLPLESLGHTVGWQTSLTVPINLTQPCSNAS